MMETLMRAYIIGGMVVIPLMFLGAIFVNSGTLAAYALLLSILWAGLAWHLSEPEDD